MRKIAITGLSGTIGAVFLKNLDSHDEIWNLYNSRPDPTLEKQIHLDLNTTAQIESTLTQIAPDIIIHMAAITHIDTCENDRQNGKHGRVWQINVDATDAIAQYCERTGTFLLFMSTECVFDGKKGRYTEQASTSPINWYGTTKEAAEQIVLKRCKNSAILRAVVAYHPESQTSTLYGSIIESIKKNGFVSAVTDRIFAPTFTEDIVNVIQQIINKNARGIFHLCSPDDISPYTFACLVAEHAGFNYKKVVQPTRSNDFFGQTRAKLRLQFATLDCTQTERSIGFHAKSVKEVLQ